MKSKKSFFNKRCTKGTNPLANKLSHFFTLCLFLLVMGIQNDAYADQYGCEWLYGPYEWWLDYPMGNFPADWSDPAHHCYSLCAAGVKSNLGCNWGGKCLNYCANAKSCTSAGNPIELYSGSKTHSEIDYTGSGNYGLTIRRDYSSSDRFPSSNFGEQWAGVDTSYVYAQKFTDAQRMTVVRPNGSRIGFALTTSWADMPPISKGEKSKLTLFRYSTTPEIMIFQFLTPAGTEEVYRFDGYSTYNSSTTANLKSYLWWTTSKEGLKHWYAYDANGRLASISDDFGHQLTYSYYASGANQGRIETISAPGNKIFSYFYDANGNLEYVSYPDDTPADPNDNPTKQYHYENSTYIHHLTGITDEENHRYATYTYDSLGRGLTTEHAGDADKVEILEYGSSFTRIRNALGKETKFNFEAIGSGASTIERVTSVEGAPSTNCDGASSSTSYDPNGFKNLVTDFSGNVIDYDYDTKGFEFKRVEAPGTDEERTILSTWIIPTAANLFQRQYLPDTITVVGHKITDYDYDAKGRIDLITETDLKTSGNPTRAWVYGYTFHFYDPDGNGIDNQTKVATITVNGPRTDITDITTQTFNTTGALLQVTNALAQSVLFSDHNAEGLPQTMTDANGTITELRYTTRGWLNTKTVKISPQDAVTDYDYYDNGLVKQITLPNGVELNYLYDEAQRLTTVTNGKGERIEYTLNALGNKEFETIYSTSNDIKRQQERAFDELGRLLKNFGLNSQELETFSYDGNGNVTQIANNNLISIVQVFDGLNRLNQVTDRANGETVYAYDDLDQLTSVTDPNTLQTTYSYTGFGFLTQVNSPDTGITNYTNYDLAGNLKSKTDARGITTQYSYDALNRLTTVIFPANPSQNYTFTYDDTANGNKGIGRRTGVTMANGSSIAWIYNNFGNVTQDTRVIDGKTLTTSYQYDLANNLTQITYPSGRIVDYVRDIDTASVIGVTMKQNASALAETIVSNVQYEPFGPVASMTFGDGFKQDNTYDLLYRPDSIITTGANNTTLQSLNYDYDLVGTLNPITDNLNSTKTQDLTYDDLYRLTDADGGYGTYHYGYDPVGNRTAQTLTNSTANFSETLTYPPTSNKLQSVAGGSNPRSLSYTAAGNLANDGRSFTYDDNNRLISVQNGATILGSYEHNPLGQRDSKTTSGGSTQFVYNLAGQLLHEESTDPAVKSRDYIYLDGMMLAIVDASAPCQPGGPCAAACAAEGTGLVTQLDILRDFRDDVLKPTALGQWLVSAYYHNVAPKAVEWMRQSEVNKTIVRAVMLPAIALAWTADFVQHSWQSLALFGLAIALYLQATLSSGLLFVSQRLLKVAALGLLFISGFSWGDDIYFVHGDHLGTPQIVTDKNKNVVWKGEYTPFGEVKEVVKQIEQPLRFPGQYHDAETGLYYNMARDYDPTTGRYIESDPLGMIDGPNTYGYVNGNPIMYVDPTGQMLWLLPLLGYGAAEQSLIALIGIITGVYLAEEFIIPNIGEYAGTGVNSGEEKCEEKNCQRVVLRKELGKDGKQTGRWVCAYKCKGYGGLIIRFNPSPDSCPAEVDWVPGDPV